MQTDATPEGAINDGKEVIDINFGIAMVIPAQRIFEILAQFSEQEGREADDVRKNRGRFVVLDSPQSSNVAVHTVQMSPNPPTIK